jgi:hypothetical protein
MRIAVALIAGMLVGVPVHAQTANPLTSGARLHYGIIKGVVTYMRLKGIVPPSSEPPFGTYVPP